MTTNELKQSIRNTVKDNASKSITGTALQGILLNMVDYSSPIRVYINEDMSNVSVGQDNLLVTDNIIDINIIVIQFSILTDDAVHVNCITGSTIEVSADAHELYAYFTNFDSQQFENNIKSGAWFGYKILYI